MERRVRRAAQCAFGIQDVLHNCELAQEVRLSVKIGIGMGKVRGGSSPQAKRGPLRQRCRHAAQRIAILS